MIQLQNPVRSIENQQLLIYYIMEALTALYNGFVERDTLARM